MKERERFVTKKKELPPKSEVNIIVSGPVSVFRIDLLSDPKQSPLCSLPSGTYTLQLRANPIAQGKKTEMWWMLTFNGVEYGMAVSGWRQSEYVTIPE